MVALVFSVAGLVFIILDLNLLPSGLLLAKVLLWVGLTLVAFLLWSGRQLGLWTLRSLELAIFGSVAVYLAAQGYTLIRENAAQGNSALALSGMMESLLHFSLLLACYGIFVPNSWQRAALVTVSLSALPLVMGSFLFLTDSGVAQVMEEMGFYRQILDAVLLLLLGMVVAVCGAYVISRYRSVVFENRQMGLYQLQKKIGAGGMGEVWLAEHQMLARPAALKMIRPDRLGNGGGTEARQVVRRFEKEARTTASLRSPNTVQLYDFGITQAGAFFYVMEYLDGFDLEALVERFGPVPGARAIYLLRQICQSLGEAHQRGLIHRDVKPGNIYLCRMGLYHDFIKVLDFGLVKESRNGDADTQITMEGSTTGTPAFMAPELALNPEQVDIRADLYSLGGVAYWLLTGQLVFEQKNPMAMVVDHVKTPPTPPSQRTELPISEELDQIVLKCLEKDPARRFQTAMELEAALARCADSSWDSKSAEDWWGLNFPVSPAIIASPAST